MQKALRVSCLLLGLLGSFSSHAAQATVTDVIDLSGTTIRNDGWGDYINRAYDFSFYNSSGPLEVASGDSVEMTIRFAKGQTVTMMDLGQGHGSWNHGWLFQDSSIDPVNTSIFSIANARVDLLDTGGNIIRTVKIESDSSGVSHLGPDAYGFLNPNESLVVGGYHTKFDVVSLEQNPSHYSGPWLYMGADKLQVSLVPEVPTYAMMLAGLGLMGTILRARRVAPRSA
jgi:hypothetical protein